jgi:hypothetical protein
MVETHAYAGAYKTTNTHKHPAVALDGICTIFENSSNLEAAIASDGACTIAPHHRNNTILHKTSKH